MGFLNLQNLIRNFGTVPLWQQSNQAEPVTARLDPVLRTVFGWVWLFLINEEKEMSKVKSGATVEVR